MAISRDIGSSFPIIAGATGTVSSVTTGTFSTNTASTLIVVRVGLGNYSGNDQHSVTVAWNGGTPAGASTFTKQAEGIITTVESEGASIWTATASQTLTTVSITVTAAASSAGSSMSVAVDALVGAATVGLTGSNQWNGVSTAAQVTLNPVVSGSWLFVATNTEVGAVTPATNTTEEDDRPVDATLTSAVGVNTTGTSGSVTVGWSTTSSFGGVAAIEVTRLDAIPLSESATASESFSVQKIRTPYTVFQPDAFQGGAFAILGPGTAGPAVPEFSESTTANDSFAPNKIAAIGAATEQVTASDTLAVNKRAAIAAATEQVTASDTLSLARSIPLSLTESATATDSIALAVATGATYEITEQATATDTLALARSIPLSLTENANPTDSLALARGLQGTFTESVSTSDLWDLTLVAAAAATFQESATATDTIISAKAIAAALPVESVSATDAFAFKLVAGLAFSESTSATDTLAVNKVARLSFIETTIPQDTWDNGAPPPAPSGTPRRTGYFIQWWRRPIMFGPLRK